MEQDVTESRIVQELNAIEKAVEDLQTHLISHLREKLSLVIIPSPTSPSGANKILEPADAISMMMIRLRDIHSSLNTTIRETSELLDQIDL